VFDDRLNSITSLTLGGANAITPVWQEAFASPNFGMWAIDFKAPVHATGAVDIVLTIDPHGSYTFTNGGVYYTPSTGVF
jgi:hypothetical protein